MSDTATTTSLPLSTGTWTLDAAHSGVHFKIRHLGLSNVRGHFETFTAALEVGDTLDDVRVTASVDLSSVNTNNPDRDAHLLSTDFFGVDSNPTLEFRSTSVTGDGSDYVLAGDLTINGVTRPVSFPVEFNGIETYPIDGSSHAGFTAETSISRKEFGIDFNVPLGVDKLALGEKVKVELDFQFVAPQQ
jgi:polyisoprenoid-binding protein YceI